jgi:hypothetical protein
MNRIAASLLGVLAKTGTGTRVLVPNCGSMIALQRQRSPSRKVTPNRK